MNTLNESKTDVIKEFTKSIQIQNQIYSAIILELKEVFSIEDLESKIEKFTNTVLQSNKAVNILTQAIMQCETEEQLLELMTVISKTISDND